MEKQFIKERIDDKISEINKFTNELFEMVPENIELEDYKRDLKTKAICERYAEKIIEAIEDLAFLVINFKELKYPEYEKEIFDILQENKIISEELAKKFKDAKGMRNIIAHKYGELDDEIVFEAATEELAKDVNRFIESIERIKTNYIIIRGPLGIGKSTIAEELSKILDAEHIAYDRILDKYKLTKDREQGFISQKSFFKANDIASKMAKKYLAKKPVILDGNFYWKSQIDDLISKLNYPHYVFTLKAPLKVCMERDSKRKKKYGKDAVLAVFKKSTSFEYGEIIDTENKTVKEVVNEIEKRLR